MLHHNISFIIIAILEIQLGAFLLLAMLKQIFNNLSEKVIIGIVANAISISILLNLALILLLIDSPSSAFIIDLGSWFNIEDSRYEIVFIADILAVSYSLFSLIMIGLVAVFSKRYLHREKGYFRFFTFMMLFVFGVNIVSFAGTMEIIIIGWEFIGLSSILLISFFNYREGPVKNALWVFTNYRLCDIGLFAAVLVMHNSMHSSNFEMLNNANWLGISGDHAPVILGFLILLGTIAKSALFPCSAWLPRAMEGPTPSSAIFYGAISVHLGPFLLLRSADLIASSPTLAITIVVIGLITAIIARILHHTQTDIKSMLAYGSVMQIGLIVAEIGLGSNILALIHIIGHGSFRTMQILRAPSLIHDLRNIEQMLGHHLSISCAGKKFTNWDYILYRFSLEKGCMDNLIKDFIIGNFLLPFRKIDALEKKWSMWLANTKSY